MSVSSSIEIFLSKQISGMTILSKLENSVGPITITDMQLSCPSVTKMIMVGNT